MRLNHDQLAQYLERQHSNSDAFPQVFLLTGDESLQMMESADLIRKFAVKKGFIEREILNTDAQFDWSGLAAVGNSLSLFSEKKVIDLRIETKTPGKAGSQALSTYAKSPAEDKILLIQLPKLTGSARNSAWVKAIDKIGVVVQIWELSTPQTMAWVSKRFRMAGLHPNADAVRLLTERVEGNLLAASQEIKKLSLLHVASNDNEKKANLIEIGESEVLAAVSDSSRFTIFDLANAVILGEKERVQHILHNLREEGVPIPLILWSLSDLSRQLYAASFSLDNGIAMGQIIARLPRPRQKPFQQALQRRNEIDWAEILTRNSSIDRMSKGQDETGNKGQQRIWSELVELALLLAGERVITYAD